MPVIYDYLKFPCIWKTKGNQEVLPAYLKSVSEISMSGPHTFTFL